MCDKVHCEECGKLLGYANYWDMQIMKHFTNHTKDLYLKDIGNCFVMSNAISSIVIKIK